MKKPMSATNALMRLEDLCARSEQCTFDIRKKLKRWEIATNEANRIMEHLVAERYVDDTRFASAYVRDKYRFARWGRYKIRTALIAKRIPSDTITEALSEIDTRQYAMIAFRVISNKLASLPHSTPEERIEARTKLLRHGASRGYEMSLLLKILNSNRLWRED